MFRVRCPICGVEADLRRSRDWACFPFCGERCRTIDLGRWLDERYGVSAEVDEAATPGELGEPSSEVP